MKAISEELLSRFKEEALQDPGFKMRGAMMSKTDLYDMAYLPQEAAKLDGPFTIELKTRGITAQQKSGRCWCFAALNILREPVAERLNVEEFKLSGNYVTFFDKLEKANNFLEMVIENAALPIGDPMMQYLCKGIGDGGYWDMAVDLINKYGVVPQSVMPETYQSEHTEKLLKLLNILLKKDAAELRRRIAAGEDISGRKDEMLGEVYRFLCTALGTPVERFDLLYRDRDGVYHAEYGLTPKRFYDKYVGIDLGEYVTVTNEPTCLVPLGQPYTFHYSGSMAESRVFCLNEPIEALKRMCIDSLKDGEAVWFGCDSGTTGDRALGIWDPNSFDYEDLMGGVDLTMSKQDTLELHRARASHAMILVGVNLDENGRPDRWKIENSWGSEVGKKGYFVCSDRYFDEYVFEAVVKKKYLNAQELSALALEPVEISPWQAY